MVKHQSNFLEKHELSARFLCIILFLTIMMFALASCSNEMDKFIQGKWASGNVHYWTEWNFDRGTYTHYFDYDINHSNTYEYGRYSIIESTEDYLVIELFNQKGGMPSIEDRVELRIDIDREEDSISIRREKYYRITDSTLKELATAKAP